MARLGLAWLRDELRRMIDDPQDGNPAFTDDELDAILSGAEEEKRYLTLTPLPDIAVGGVYVYHEFVSLSYYNWSADSIIQNMTTWEVVTPDHCDWKRGRWRFHKSQVDNFCITGYCYSPEAAAVEAYDQWMSKLKLEFDVSTPYGTASRSQVLANLEARKQAMLKRSGSRLVDTWRMDTRGAR